MTDHALQSIASNVGSGWHIAGGSGSIYGDSGYYIHRSRVYLAGLVGNYVAPGDTPSSPGATVLTGLPEVIRPSSTQAVTLYTDHVFTTDPATPGIVTPDVVTATVTPGGDLVLDSLPPLLAAGRNGSLWHISDYSSSGPGPHVPDFPTAIYYALTLGTVSWPLASPLPDTWSGASMAAFLDGQFDDIDSVISTHDARVHLGGRVRANVNGAQVISFSLPSSYRQGIATHAVTKGQIGGHASLPVVLMARSSGRLAADTDNPAPIAPPPRYPRSSSSRVIYEGDLFGGFGSYQSIIAGLEAFPYPGTGRPPPGFGRQQALISDTVGAAWDNGTYDCPSGDPLLPGPVHCPAPGGGAGALIDISGQISAYYPEPDWVAVEIVVFGLGESVEAGGSLQPVGFYDYSIGCGTEGGCGLFSDTPCNLHLSANGSCDLLSVATYTPVSTPLALPGHTNGQAGGLCSWDGFHGFVQRPGAVATYTDDPNNLGATCLWRPGEVPTLYALGAVGDSNRGALGFEARVIPLWNRRKTWFMEGDVLDLANAGWHSPFTPVVLPQVPTTVAAGPGKGGQVRGKHNLGSTREFKYSNKAHYSIANLVYLAISVGLNGEPAAIAGAVAMAESGGDPSATNYNEGPPPSIDRGLWQINDYFHPDVSDACAYDPTCNAHAMVAISSGGTNWTPWATYTNGAYLTYLAEAEAALSGLTSGTQPALLPLAKVSGGSHRTGVRRHG